MFAPRVLTVAVACGVVVIAGCSKSQAPSPAPYTSEPAVQSMPQEAAPAATPAEVPSEPSQNAVQAYVDPQTGELREPTPEEMAAQQQRTDRRPAAATVPTVQKEVRLPDGTVGVILDGSANESLQGCVQPDGSVVVDHSCDAAAKKKGEKP